MPRRRVPAAVEHDGAVVRQAETPHVAVMAGGELEAVAVLLEDCGRDHVGKADRRAADELLRAPGGG